MVPRKVRQDHTQRKRTNKKRKKYKLVSNAVIQLFFSTCLACTSSFHVAFAICLNQTLKEEDILFSTRNKIIVREVLREGQHSGHPPSHQVKEICTLILDGTMQKHGVTKPFVSEAPSLKQLKKARALRRPSCATGKQSKNANTNIFLP